jgi:uncharacterized protein YjdB
LNNIITVSATKKGSESITVKTVEVNIQDTTALITVLKNGFQEYFQEVYEHWQKCVTAQGNISE